VKPFQISPFPSGKHFALTFIDDTDFSTRENTEPVYDFLAQRGFWGTKTVWPLQARRTSAFTRPLERPASGSEMGASLADADYLDFVFKLRRMGFEIALHGVAAGNSTRSEIEQGLERYRSLLGQPAINAFHRTNIENLYCGADKLDARPLRLLERIAHSSQYEGHREGAPSFWGDLVQDTFEYVRLPFHTIDAINTLHVNPSLPFRDPRRPFVRRWFASSDGGDVVRFVRLLSPRHVDRLERERGVCIIYTHFAKQFAYRSHHRYQLDEDFVRCINDVTGRSGAWFAPATEVLRRLEAIKAVSLVHQGRSLTVANSSHIPIDDLVIHGGGIVPSAGVADSAAPVSTITVPHIGPAESIVLRTVHEGRQAIPAGAIDISLRERRRLEYANYLGLIRGLVNDRAHYQLRHWRRKFA
jgi:hypothetical protein